MVLFKSYTTLLAAAATLVSAWPQPPLRAHILGRQEIQDEYDYIIVGGGTSGLTVGDRLTENGQYSVLVIEIGLYHTATGMDASRMFDITSQPSPVLNGRTFFVGLGRGVGGSSIVNGQLQTRGTKEEYDAWKELGGPDSTWDWEGLLPYFKKSVQLVPPPDAVAEEFNVKYNTDYWGDDSEIYATFGQRRPANLTKELYAAMASLPGITVAEDSGSGETGLYYYSMSKDPVTGLRSYARTGHWDNVPRDNYQLIVGSKVTKILLNEDLAATGVEFVSVNETDAAPKTVSARREVILAAGTVHTPQVLMLSGIGSSAALESYGIETLVDLPGVGSNFQDHHYIPTIGYRWGAPPPNPGFPDLMNAPNLLAMVGLPVISPSRYEELATKFEEKDPASHLPESYTPELIEGYRQQQAVFGRLMRSPNTTFLEMMLFGPGGSIQNLHPASRGTVTLNPENPGGKVIVDYRAASNDIDLDVMVENIDFLRRYMATEQLAKYRPIETLPGANFNTASQLLDWAKGQIIPSVYHPVGTCAKVPRESGGVVSEDLLVYGTSKLSIIDASIFPTLVGATTQGTVYAVAEKAADIIKARTFDA